VEQNTSTKYLNFIQQSPSWEADSSSAGQEIPHILFNLKVRYLVHNSPPLFFNVTQVTFRYGKELDTV